MDDWDAQLMFNKYLYDYLKKKNMHRIAERFRVEAELPSDLDLEVDIPDGFLHEWWLIFYDVFKTWQQPHPDNLEPAPSRMKDQSLKYYLQQALHIDVEPAPFSMTDQSLKCDRQQPLHVDPQPAPSVMTHQSLECHLQQSLHLEPTPSCMKDQSLENKPLDLRQKKTPYILRKLARCVQNPEVSSRLQSSVNSKAPSPLSTDSGLRSMDNPIRSLMQPVTLQNFPSSSNQQELSTAPLVVNSPASGSAQATSGTANIVEGA